MGRSLSNQIRNAIKNKAGLILHERSLLRSSLVNAEHWLEKQKHTAAHYFPPIIQPHPYILMIAVTAHCNLRCLGCRYGRDFMPGSQLSWHTVRGILDDAKDAGIYKIRLYGGEPLLHPDLPKMIAYCRKIGLKPGVTTNAMVLEHKIDLLYDAGLRDISIGFYGTRDNLDDYTQRHGCFRRLEAGVQAVREHYGNQVDIQINWLLRRQSCTPEALRDAFDFALRYDTKFQVDLIHYSLPYFTEGPEHSLQFRPEDHAAIKTVVDQLLKLKIAYPDKVQHTVEAIRAIPDWLLLGPRMRIPCTAYEMIWIGANGSVQLCYVTHPLGNIHEQRLKDMLFNARHKKAARDAFALKCPNCHCSAGTRIMRDASSHRRYRAMETNG